MDTMLENKVVPKLRFREFNDNWVTNKLHNIFTIKAGGDISKKNVSKVKTEIFKYPIYANAKENKGFYAYSDIYTTKSNVVTVAGRGVNLGVAHSRKENFFPIVRLLVLIPKNKCDIDYFEHRINLIKFYIESTGVPQLTVPQISNYNVSFPSLAEQQKIASFLSAIVKKLQQLTKKKELLEDYKKGIMQKIFFQEIRFKDDNGNSYNDWKKRKLIEIGEIICGKTPRTNDKSLWSGHIQFITPTDITDGNKYQHNVKRFVTENSKIKVLPLNTIVYTCVASIGKVAITSKPATTNQQINALVTYKDYYYELIYYALLYLTPRIKSIKSTTTLPIINKTEFSNIIINIPDASEEQKKVGEFLSAIDKKIKLVNNQLEKTKEFKKGLLQQMFV